MSAVSCAEARLQKLFEERESLHDEVSSHSSSVRSSHRLAVDPDRPLCLSAGEAAEVSAGSERLSCCGPGSGGGRSGERDAVSSSGAPE